MKSRRSKSVLVVLSLLAVIVLTGSGDAPAAVVANRITIPIAGIVDGLPESVSLSGRLAIVSTPVVDPLQDSPRERVSIKLVGVSGVGLTSGAKYVATGENALLRRMIPSDQIEIMFPVYRPTPVGPRAARSAMATITLKFDLPTGALTGATARFAAPKLAG